MAIPTFLPTLSSSLSLAGVLFLLYWGSIQLSRRSNPLRKLPYPPGPPPRDFFLGNARDLLSSPLWFTFTDWAAKYGMCLRYILVAADITSILGSITHLKALNIHIVVLNSVDDATELLEKRSNIYSDRPSVPMMDLYVSRLWVCGYYLTPSFMTPLSLVQGVHLLLHSSGMDRFGKSTAVISSKCLDQRRHSDIDLYRLRK